MKKISITIIAVFTFFSLIYAGAFHDYVQKCDMASIKKFVTHGVDINSMDDVGFSPLHIAMLSEDVCGKGIKGDKKRFNLVSYLLKNGADANIVKDDSIGRYPPFFSCHNCNSYAVKCYELITKNKAELKNDYTSNIDSDGNEYTENALSIIFSDLYFNYQVHGKVDCRYKIPSIKYLLDKKLEVNNIIFYGNKGKKTILDMAFEIGNFKIISLLKKYGAKKRIDIEVENIEK